VIDYSHLHDGEEEDEIIDLDGDGDCSSVVDFFFDDTISELGFLEDAKFNPKIRCCTDQRQDCNEPQWQQPKEAVVRVQETSKVKSRQQSHRGGGGGGASAGMTKKMDKTIRTVRSGLRFMSCIISVPCIRNSTAVEEVVFVHV